MCVYINPRLFLEYTKSSLKYTNEINDHNFPSVTKILPIFELNQYLDELETRPESLLSSPNEGEPFLMQRHSTGGDLCFNSYLTKVWRMKTNILHLNC